MKHDATNHDTSADLSSFRLLAQLVDRGALDLEQAAALAQRLLGHAPNTHQGHEEDKATERGLAGPLSLFERLPVPQCTPETGNADTGPHRPQKSAGNELRPDLEEEGRTGADGLDNAEKTETKRRRPRYDPFALLSMRLSKQEGGRINAYDLARFGEAYGLALPAVRRHLERCGRIVAGDNAFEFEVVERDEVFARAWAAGRRRPASLAAATGYSRTSAARWIARREEAR